MIKLTDKGKYQSIPKKICYKKIRNILENISEEIIIGINNIMDSKIINLRVFNPQNLKFSIPDFDKLLNFLLRLRRLILLSNQPE